MKFKDLSLNSKKRAVCDYISGWEETHDVDDMSYDEAYFCLIDLDDDYLEDGQLIEKEE